MTAKRRPGMVAAGTVDLSAEAATLPPYKCGRYGHVSKQTGKPCRQNVVEGTHHCVHHAGKSLEQHRAEGQIRIAAADFADKFRLDSFDGADLDPRLEILRLIAFWKWRANFYGGLVFDAKEAAERLQQAHAAGALLLADPKTETRVDDEGEYAGETPEAPHLQTARLDLERIFASGGVTAFVGHRHDVDRDGRVYAVEEAIRALITLEERAHTMLAKMCQLAVQAKVADARIQMAEQVGVMLQTVILGVLRDLGVSAMDRKVQDLIVMHIDNVTAAPALTA